MAAPYTDSDFLPWLRQQIPLLDAMQVSNLDYQPGVSLSLSAPLAPNINDKGTGFAGALATLATISGWALVTRIMADHQLRGDVVIARSEQQYLAPVTSDFTVSARLAPTVDLAERLPRLQARGKTAFALEVELSCNGQICLTLEAIYVARLVAA